jgi:putative tricarboxylic transport membrane protein
MTVSWTRVRIVAVVLVAIGVAGVLAALAIPSTRYGWTVSGPRLAPFVVAVAFLLLALAFLVRTFVAQDEALAEHAAREMAETHWPTPGLILALLVGYVLVLEAIGYALATTIFVWLTAWVLGSRKPVRDVVVGLVLGVVAGYAFGQWLNVQLPTGPWGV